MLLSRTSVEVVVVSSLDVVDVSLLIGVDFVASVGGVYFEYDERKRFCGVRFGSS